ncbi:MULTISPECIES: DUF2634 domain-containing protein [Peptostreptococcus]|uniref:Putative phage protein XkdS n=1 Tax=Peptostreptococcus anaerobius TaxID=1261 RepID=A0A135YQ20_9FIRM|nr:MULTISPECIES: DUF2634 domain-containing protein [Peptostreptococcus]KXI11480.1 putative phage protein XkdS [Peptostreptococcus anaerobius]MDU1264526.1 DUF2634 domain-containing protein [Peptostreptococcus sp.]
MIDGFPFAGAPEDYNISEDVDLPVPVEAGIDFETGEVLLDESGQVKLVEGIEAIKVWCYLAIKTQRYAHQIFTEEYGSQHEELIGYEYTKELTETEAYRYINECLMKSPYVLGVKNLGVHRTGDKLNINIEIETSYGTDRLKGVA